MPWVLFGHGVRGLVWNPVFALLPLFYLDRLARAESAPWQLFWLLAFILGLPHAGYTALEIRHYIDRDDEVAGARTTQQLLFFSSYLVFGVALSTWYVYSGGEVITRLLGLGRGTAMLGLAAAGSVGAIVGIQDVLVMDLVSRPALVLRSILNSLTQWRWLRIILPWTALQLLLALGLTLL